MSHGPTLVRLVTSRERAAPEQFRNALGFFEPSKAQAQEGSVTGLGDGDNREVAQGVRRIRI